MAFKVSSDAQLIFFQKLFGTSSSTAERVKGLVGAGVTFEVALHSVRATVNGKAVAPCVLTYGTTSLMKGLANPLIESQNKKLIEDWVAFLYEKHGSPVAALVPTKVVVLGVQPGDKQPNIILLIKTIRTVTGQELAPSKIQAEQILAGANVELVVKITLDVQTAVKMLNAAGVQVTTDAKTGVKTLIKAFTGAHTAAKPVNTVISLKDAAALGQKVHGTSSGSVYHTIALTDHLKLAARLYKGGTISIRAEWTDTPTTDLKKLEAAGLVMKSGYGSIHFDAAEVPVERVVGAFLVGTGINWKAAVMNGAELVIAEPKS